MFHVIRMVLWLEGLLFSFLIAKSNLKLGSKSFVSGQKKKLTVNTLLAPLERFVEGFGILPIFLFLFFGYKLYFDLHPVVHFYVHA